MNFTDKLRAAAKALASGAEEKIVIPARYFEHELKGKKSEKNPTSYVRSIMNRTQEVKEVGSVKINKSMCYEEDSEFFGDEIYTITIVNETRRKVFTDKDLPGIKAKAVCKALKCLTETMPDITDLEGEQLQGAAIALKRYKDMIIKMMGANNEDDL